MADLEISLLGGFALRRPDDRPNEPLGRKDCALLGYLALSLDRPCPREKLAALLWGDSNERQARDSLKQALLRLRRALAATEPPALATDRHMALLRSERLGVDVVRFERFLKEGTTEALERAIELYHGDLLDGLQVRSPAFEDWLLLERQRLRGLVTEAATALMQQWMTVGQRERAAVAARRLLLLDPLHEAACRLLMRLHAERGERAQAMKLFQGLRERLQLELRVAPEPETLQLHHSIRGYRVVEKPEDLAPGHGPSRATGAKPSLAVLPLVNIGGDPEQEYFADGLTEDLITDLSRISALSVVARHLVFALKGSAGPPQGRAKELGVDYLLQGSLRKAADRVRINVQLIEGSSGRHLWAHRYDRRLDDIFALQDEIAASIVAVLRVKLLPEELDDIASRSTSSAEAYQYYLMGRAFYLRGVDRHSLRIARQMFSKAVEIDPGYARAYAAAAFCESYLATGDPQTTYDSYLANSRRALELDPQLAEASALEGLALYAEGRYAEAEAEFERAMRRDPELFETHFFYGRNCRLRGRHREAAALFRKAAALRPRDFRALGLAAKSYKILGCREQSLAAARECLERLETEIEEHPDNAGALAFGSTILAELGAADRARDWAVRAMIIGPEEHVARYNIARTHALLGEIDAALDWLERAFDSSAVWRHRLGLWMKGDSDIDPLRGHPRFLALVRRLENERPP